MMDDENNWLKNAVVYQVYPRSFSDSNGDGIGDLQGVIDKLDYLNDGTENSLGVDAIWLSPVYVSPMKDFGYDVVDHCDIDPMFGDLATFDRLVTEVHRRGMKIIMDYIPNHTSSEHPWFVESRSSRTNPKRDWYIWRRPKSDARLPGGQGSPPNNWVSRFGGSAWTFDPATGEYYFHNFLPEQPELNWRNRDVRDAMKRIMRFWLDRGVDGFRTDSTNYLLEMEGFEDEPPNPDYVPGKSNPYDALLHIYSHGRPETLIALNIFCQVLGEYVGRYMVSESYIDIPHMLRFYNVCPDDLVQPFNFNLIGLPWSAREYRKFVDELEATLRDRHWPNYVIGNHDLPRIVSRVGVERARLLAMLIFTLRGTTFVYYGDEIGMENVPIPDNEALDPRGWNVPGFGSGRDPARTPMQWDGGIFAGFSSGKPWLPVSDNKDWCNVATERDDEGSMFSLYRRLIHTRNSHTAFLAGAYRSVDGGSDEVFCYYRESDNGSMFVALNFSAVEQTITAPSGKIICTTIPGSPQRKISDNTLVLRPYEGVIIEL